MRTRLIPVVAGLLTLAGLVVPVSAAATDRPQLQRLDAGGRQCQPGGAVPALGTFADLLDAYGTEPGADPTSDATYTFQVWPKDDPASVTTLTDDTQLEFLGRAQIPDGVLADGVRYLWRARLRTSDGDSPWSGRCAFDVDTTDPSTPTVTSPNFPDPGTWGPAGQLARFELGGGGDTDIAGYRWAWGELGVLGCEYSGPQGQLECPDFLGGRDVALPEQPGGHVELRLSPPGDFTQTLWVQSIDRAGNVSAPVSYDILVPPTGPAVAADTTATCGPPVILRVRPNPSVPPVRAYLYSTPFDSHSTKVLADASGITRLSVSVPDGFQYVDVRSVSTNGFVSSAYRIFVQHDQPPDVTSDVYVDSGTPVGGIGQTGAFTFAPQDGDYAPISTYTYRFNGGPVRTVAANSGRATVRWAPRAAGPHTLSVTASDADRAAGCRTRYHFIVAGQ